MADKKQQTPDYPMPQDVQRQVKPSHGAQVVLTGKAQDAARGAVAADIAGNTAVKNQILGTVSSGTAPDELRRANHPLDGSEQERKMLDQQAADGEDVRNGSDVPNTAPAVTQPTVAPTTK